MSLLFNRDFNVQVGPVKIAARPKNPLGGSSPALRVTFEVQQSTSADPNTAKIEVFNLSETHRKALQQANSRPQGVTYPILVQAGYVGTLSELFRGDLIDSTSVCDGPNWVTTIQAGDGTWHWQTARMTKSYSPGTTLLQVIADVVKSFGILPGNALARLATPPRGPTVFFKGVSVNGSCAEILNRFVHSAGLQWNINGGELLILERDEVAKEMVVILNEKTGLIGSPELGKGGVLRAKSLLQGAIRPGKRIGIESRDVDGFFKVEKSVHTGDTWGTEWYSSVEAKAIAA